MPISLIVRGPGGDEKRLDFDRSKVTIGADALCDITVADPGVDREQAILVERQGVVELFDIGESGGVLVNGRPAGHAALKSGDEIWIGGTVLRLAAEAAAGVAFTERVSTVREELPVAAPAPAPAPVVVPLPGVKPPAEDQRFALLNQVRRLINSIGSGENIFESVLDTLFASVPVRRGFIGIIDGQGELAVRAFRSREAGAAANEKIEVSRTLVGKVLSTGKAVLTSDAEADADFSAARSIHRLRIKAAICVPLVAEERVLGVLYGDNRERPGSLVKDHLAILNALASVAAVAVEKIRLLREAEAKRKIEQALAIARSIQRHFLPLTPPEVPGLEVWGRSDSCDETGGDYFDYFPLDGGKLAVTIADVTGHGIGPALLMATARAALRVLVPAEPSLERLVYRLNNLVREDVRDGRFITLFMAMLDPKGGSFAHVGAGHTPPVWYRARDKTTHLISSAGPPLGILPGLQFRAGTTLPIARGDVLLFSTDGILEAGVETGDPFGYGRLRSVLSEHVGGSAKAIVEAVCAAADAHVKHEALPDDATLVAVKIL